MSIRLMKNNTLVILSVVVLVSGCYYEDIPRSTDPDLCTNSNVSYANVIAPIISARCNISTCHGNSGTQSNLTSYEGVRQRAADIKARTASGNMPKQPKPGGSLTADEIKLIACWVHAGAPNN